MSRTYEDAVALLNTRPREVSKAHMREWLQQIGANVPRFPVIHITGTKGKGSTAAYTDALLRAHFHHNPNNTSSKKLKIGLYTSPHLVTERERIRINFECVSEVLFARCLFEVWDAALDAAASIGSVPGYHQLVTLTSILAFGYEDVDIVIYEVHCGGRNDATNIFEASQKVVCGFTTMALDHIGVLGHSVADVAWHKSGIMRRGVPCFSMAQDEPEARDMLLREANNTGCSIDFVAIRDDLPIVPKLEVETQRMNLSLAIELANAYLQYIPGGADRSISALSAEDVARAVDLFDWPGRFQRIDSALDRWFLDTAHNAISLPIAIRWYAAELRRCEEAPKNKVLVFGHQAKRDSSGLLKAMSESCRATACFFDMVILVCYDGHGFKVWTDEDVTSVKSLFEGMHTPQVMIASSVKDARMKMGRLAEIEGVNALVTGAGYLVGETLAELASTK